jgi:membrane protein
MGESAREVAGTCAVFRKAVTLTPRMRLKILVREVVDGFEQNDLLTYASAIAFQILTAIVPFMLFLLGVLGFLSLDEVWRTELAPEIEPHVSQPVFSLFDNTARKVLHERQIFWISAGLLIALWQVSGAVRAVMGALDGVYGAEGRRPARERYPLSVVLAIAVGVLLILAFGVVRVVPVILDDTNGLLAAAEFLARWSVATALVALAVAILMHYAPGVSRPLPWVTFGAGLVIAGWVAMSIGFGVYLSEIADYDSIFGHLATAIVLMAYLYAGAVVFVGGAQLDACVREGMAPRPELSR